MRRRTQASWWLVGIVVPLLLLGAGGGDLAKEADDGIDVYFRDTDLEALAKQDAARFPVTDAGESELIKRSFPDAPPSIPHTVEDMYPITARRQRVLGVPPSGQRRRGVRHSGAQDPLPTRP